jgi:SNF2 family DNA or RNA helicase
LEELWALLHFLMPKFFELTPDEKAVFAELTRLKRNDRDAAAEMELEMVERMKKALAPFFLRRVKSEVGLQLLPKTTKLLRCNLVDNQRSIYSSVFAQSRKAWQAQAFVLFLLFVFSFDTYNLSIYPARIIQ